MAPRAWITSEQMAQRLKCSRPTAITLLLDGRVPVRYERRGVSRAWYRIDRDEFERWWRSFRATHPHGPTRRRRLLWHKPRPAAQIG